MSVDSTETPVEVHGQVAPGFEAVRDAFASTVSDLGPGGGAFCMYVGGRQTADLWAGEGRPGTPWERDTIAPLLSASKGLTALCALILADRGELDVDQPVARYWPEFAEGGKGAITVRQLLSHQSGVLTVPGYEDFMSLDGRGWDQYDEITRRLAAASPLWEPGSRHGYHGVTFGYLAGALVERISGQDLGTFFKEQVARPLGADVWLGLPDSERPRLSQAIDFSEQPPDVVPEPFRPLFVEGRDPSTLTGKVFLARDGQGVLDVLGKLVAPDSQMLANHGGFGDGTGTAAGIARVYALLAEGGELDGVRLARRETIELFSEAQVAGMDQILLGPSSYALGFQVNQEVPGLGRVLGPSAHAFGHGGAGGQFGFCDPENRLAFGIVRSRFTLVSPMMFALLGAMYQSLAG